MKNYVYLQILMDTKTSVERLAYEVGILHS